MKSRFAAYATFIALSATMTVAAHAASQTNPAQDQSENAITAQLNQQQADMNGGYGVETYQGIMHSPNQGATQEQIAQPPSDDSNLSIIE
jgi:hypothetical protein